MTAENGITDGLVAWFGATGRSRHHFRWRARVFGSGLKDDYALERAAKVEKLDVSI